MIPRRSQLLTVSVSIPAISPNSETVTKTPGSDESSAFFAIGAEAFLELWSCDHYMIVWPKAKAEA